MAIRDFFKRFAVGDTKEGRPEMGERGIMDVMGSAAFGTAPINLYNPSELVSRKGLYVYDRMRIDEQIKAAMTFKKGTVVATGWELLAPDGQEDDWEVAEFVRKNLVDLGAQNILRSSRKGLTKALREVLTALDYGFSATEKIWAMREDGKVCLQDLKTRAPHQWEFVSDKHGNIIGVKQWDITMPPNKFVIYAYDAEFQNPYGTADLEAAYRAWTIKANTYRWLSVYLEKHGIPPIFALYNPDALDREDQSLLQKIMKNLQSATVGMVARPEKDDLELWSPQISGAINDVFGPALDRFDKDIAKAILMPGLLGFTPDEGVGSQARAQTHFDVFMLVVEAVREDLERLVNDEIVRPLVDFNFAAVEEYPLFQFKPMTKELNDQLLQRWKELVGVKVVHPQEDDERHIRDLMDFPPMSEETAEAWDDEEEEPPLEPPGEDDDEDDPLPDPEEDDDDEDELDQREFALNRQPNKYEKKVDFQLINRELDQLEEQGLNELATIMTGIREKFLSLMQNRFKPTQTFVRKIDLRGMQDWTNKLEETMRLNLELGRERVRAELPQTFSERGPAFLQSEALSELKTRALEQSTTVRGRLVGELKQILMNGISLGKSVADMRPEIEEAFRPYIGNPAVLKNGEPLSKFMVENVVRTESTRAFNRGRLTQMRSPEAENFIQGVEYSAILDGRTTPVCQELDGKIFRLGADDLTALTPPNHYQCRSVLVPVTIDEEVAQEDFISPAQIGRGKQLANKGFA